MVAISLGLSSFLAHASDPAPTFYPRVAELLERHCMECHRPGQVAPMSLQTWEEARPWARSIAQKVATRAMPPFHAEGPLGRFRDDPRLSESEIATIVGWARGGAAHGDPESWTPSRTWHERGWTNGEPDIVVDLPAYAVHSDLSDDNVVLFMESPFEQETWIRGIEILPSEPGIVHHATLFLMEPGFKPDRLVDRNVFVDFGELVQTWLPGYETVLLPENEGRLIPPGVWMGLFAHYAPGGQKAVDQTRVGIYLANGTIFNRWRYVNIKPGKIDIAPGEAHYEIRRRYALEKDANLVAFGSHMHYRGKSFEVLLHPPQGEASNVFRIPQYDFNWQREYFLAHPIRADAGSELEFVGVWDNSDQNPANPDPTVAVKTGFRSEDEMWAPWMRYELCDTPENFPIEVENGLVVGP